MLETLQEIGLSQKEVKVYETLFTEEEMSVNEISKKTKLNRTYCYDILNKLLKRGFVIKSIVNNKTLWQTESPEKIILHLDNIKNEIYKSLKKNEPKRKKTAETKIKIYEGKGGIRSVCEEITNSKEKVLGFGTAQNLKKFLPYSYKHIFNKLRKNKVKFELIAQKDKIPTMKNLTKYKTFKTDFDVPVELNVYENKTIIFFWKNPLKAILIEDQDVANCFKNYHKLLWKNSTESKD